MVILHSRGPSVSDVFVDNKYEGKYAMIAAHI